MLFELFNQPARIINADIELVARAAQKSAREFAQFARRSSGEHRQLRAARPIDQTIFQINSNLRVRSFEQLLDLAEERLVHKQSDGRAPSSKLSSRSESSFSASRTSRNRPAKPSNTSLSSQRRAAACE